MAFNPSTPVTGGAQTGFTSPTYTIGADQAPDVNCKQFYVSALGGTQAGVDASSIARPFTLSMWKPKVYKTLKPVNSNGVLPEVPMNDHKVITRKGVLPLAGQASKTAVATTTFSVPAGADTADPSNVRALVSLHVGALWAQSAGIGDTIITGVL